MPGEFEYLELERIGTDGRVARITLNRPEKMNALSQEVLHDLEADDSARVIVVRGAGRTFSAGYDLTPTRGGADAIVRRHRNADDKGRRLVMGTRTGMQQVTDIHMYFWNMAKVTVAQVHGYALAGGCELAMMADLVVAAEDAQFGHPALRGMGTSRTGIILPLVIGMRKAKEMYYTGDSVGGIEAEKIGLINHAWPGDELERRATAYANRLANLSADHLALLKLNMNRFYENMGIYSSVRSSTDMDAFGQFTNHSYAWQDTIKQANETGGGLKEALAWRDGPYKKNAAME